MVALIYFGQMTQFSYILASSQLDAFPPMKFDIYERNGGGIQFVILHLFSIQGYILL